MSNNTQPKYNILKDYIKNEILSGSILPGQQLPSENTLKTMFSVSRHTVRKAISLLTVEGYVYTEHGRGSFCSGRNADRAAFRNIGVLTTYISEYIFPQLIQGMESTLSQNGYSILLKNTNNDPAKEALYLEDMLKKDIAGLIIEPTKSSLFLENEKLYHALDRYGIPYVFIHGCYPQLEDKPQIALDDTWGMYTLVTYLIQNGHKNIVGIFKVDDIQGINRHKGYVQALADHQIPYDPDRVIWFHTEDRLKKPAYTLERMLQSEILIHAIACYNDEIAHGVIEYLLHKKLRIPEDISVTGFDDAYLATSGTVKLTTMRHPKELLGQLSAEVMLKIIASEAVETTHLLKPELVVRQSTLKRD